MVALFVKNIPFWTKSTKSSIQKSVSNKEQSDKGLKFTTRNKLIMYNCATVIP